MSIKTRRRFLGDLGGGLALLGLGGALFPTRALARVAAGDGELALGELEPLVRLQQDTPPDVLLPRLVDELGRGTSLHRLVAAGALANAITFGGESYTGYHAFMALIPALEMAFLLPGDARPLPVLKVLHRNATFLQEVGGRSHQKLHPVPIEPDASADPVALRKATRAGDVLAAERTFRRAFVEPGQAYDALQDVLHDDIDVHRVVLAWRSWDMLSLVGTEHAHTMLRQSLRHCVDVEQRRLRRGQPEPALRQLLPALIDEHGLGEGARGSRVPDDAFVDELAGTIFRASRADAAAAMASALAEGHAPDALGECLSLVGQRLVMHDRGRTAAQPGKPVGSVHGASYGVHGSDAARAWRSLVRVVSPTQAAAGLVVAAYHAGGQSEKVGRAPFPWRDRLDELGDHDAAALRDDLAQALADNDQALACAAVHRSRQLGADDAPLVRQLLSASLEADGALHAEKYFSTVHQELAEARPAFRHRHLLGLARVAASQHGFPAPGLAQARELLAG